MLRRAFTEHPESVGENYWQHMGTAFGFGLELGRAAFCCVMHGIFPFLFVKTGSVCIEGLHRKMVTHRSRLDPDQALSSLDQVPGAQSPAE